MARPEGLEPPTTWFEARYSLQMGYGRWDEVALPGALPAGTGAAS